MTYRKTSTWPSGLRPSHLPSRRAVAARCSCGRGAERGFGTQWRLGLLHTTTIARTSERCHTRFSLRKRGLRAG